MKKKYKKTAKKAIIIVLICIAVLFLAKLLPLSIFDTQQNLGYWEIESYNRLTEELIIPISLQSTSEGSFGVQKIHRLGTPAMDTQEACEEVGFSWRTQDTTPGDGYQCFLNNPDWFKDKTYTTDIICTNSNPRSTVTGVYEPARDPPFFDGFRIYFPNLKRSLDDVVICQGEITVKSSSTPSIPPALPSEPPKPRWENIINFIISWIKNIFNISLSVAGETEVSPGSTQTYQIDLSTEIPDSDYSDGYYEVLWGSWSMVDKEGNIRTKGEWEKVYDGRYSKNITITVPSNPGDYAIIGLIYKYEISYNSDLKDWIIISEEVEVREGLSVATKVPSPVYPKPIWEGIIDSLRNFWEWLKNFFI